jgi:glycosyltransferase involved in cell wall biosynthesis
MMASARVLHLAPAHATFDTRVFVKECRTLADAGYQVSLVVRHDRAESVDGVRIVPLPPWRSRAGRFIANPWRCLRIALRERADLYHFHDAEMLPVGALLALLGRTVVYDSHEDLPRLARDRVWIPRPLRSVASWLVALVERLVTPLFAAVVSAEDEGAKRFGGERVVVIRNYVLRDEFDTTEPVDWASRRNTMIYVGAMSHQRGAVEMVEVVEALADIDARLTLIGTMNVSGLEAELRALPGWSRVDYLGFGDRATVMKELARARVGLVLWHPTRKHAEGAVPVKLFEYLAAGIPVIASDFPAIREVLGPCDVGVLVDPLDVDQIAEVARQLLADPARAAEMGRKGRELVRDHYTWDSQAPLLLDLYRRILS